MRILLLVFLTLIVAATFTIQSLLAQSPHQSMITGNITGCHEEIDRNGIIYRERFITQFLSPENSLHDIYITDYIHDDYGQPSMLCHRLYVEENRNVVWVQTGETAQLRALDDPWLGSRFGGDCLSDILPSLSHSLDTSSAATILPRAATLPFPTPPNLLALLLSEEFPQPSNQRTPLEVLDTDFLPRWDQPGFQFRVTFEELHDATELDLGNNRSTDVVNQVLDSLAVFYERSLPGWTAIPEISNSQNSGTLWLIKEETGGRIELYVWLSFPFREMIVLVMPETPRESVVVTPPPNAAAWENAATGSLAFSDWDTILANPVIPGSFEIYVLRHRDQPQRWWYVEVDRTQAYPWEHNVSQTEMCSSPEFPEWTQ